MAKKQYEYAVGIRVNRTTFSPSHTYGRHPTNVAAKRAYCVVWWGAEAVAQWSDEYVKTQYDAVARNEKSTKILKLEIA
jgi:hypothetical protein